MERTGLIDEIQNVLFEIYKENDLTSLKGLDRKYIVNGRQILQWHSDMTRKGSIKYYKNFNFHSNFDDILFCSDEVLFFLGQMYLYKPFITNPLDDTFSFEGKVIYPYYENRSAHRYSMYSHVVVEKIYNYWDRIGDLIAVYFPEVFKNPKRIFFPDVIDNIPKQFYSSENFKWLKDFRETDYKVLNNERIQNVHYLSADRRFKDKHLDSIGDKEAIEELVKNRINLTEEFKKHIYFSLDGFEKTILLVEEITQATISDAEIEEILKTIESESGQKTS